MRPLFRLMTAAALACAGSAAAQSPGEVTDPDWLRKPTVAEIGNAWPARARALHVGKGKAVMTCAVTARGLLDQCRLKSEAPAGYGFGGAALSLAPMMMMKPKTVNGEAVDGGSVTIPIAFDDSNLVAPRYGTFRDGFQLFSAVWLQAPNADALAAAFPNAAQGKAAMGHVVLHCGFAESGSLSSCSVAQETPTGLGFGAAAKALSKQFRADVNQFAGHPPILTRIDLPIHFMDPTSDAWRKRTLAQPVWIAAPAPDQVAAAYPPMAHAAGLKTGLGRIDCMVLDAGKLGDCHIQDENPGNLGFGQAALKLAPAFAMNAWTSEGLPAQGVRIALPVRLSDNGTTPATKP